MSGFFGFVILSSFVIRLPRRSPAKAGHSSFSRGRRVDCKTLLTVHDERTTTKGFTILELLVVITIIIVLAGLILATVGYVQKKGARSRAEAEIAAISAALESYRADNGIYPTDPSTTETLKPNIDPGGGDPTNYPSSGMFLYKQISGDSDGDPTNGVEGKSYFGGSLKPNMLSNPPGPNTYIRDPFGYCYGYSTVKSANPGGTDGYNPTFDLWSTCGETSKKSGETFQQYQQRWVKNW